MTDDLNEEIVKWFDLLALWARRDAQCPSAAGAVLHLPRPMLWYLASHALRDVFDRALGPAWLPWRSASLCRLAVGTSSRPCSTARSGENRAGQSDGKVHLEDNQSGHQASHARGCGEPCCFTPLASPARRRSLRFWHVDGYRHVPARFGAPKTHQSGRLERTDLRGSLQEVQWHPRSLLCQ